MQIYEQNIEQQDNKIEQELMESYRLYIHKQLQKQKKYWDRIWQKYLPAFRYYLSGHTAGETAKKYNIPRCEFYHILKHHFVRQHYVSDTQTSMMARRIAANVRLKDLTRLRKCNCWVCQFLVGKIERRYKLERYI